MLSTKSKFTRRQVVLAVLLLVLVVSVSATGLLTGPQSGTQDQQRGPQLSGPILGQTAQTPSEAQAAENARQAQSTLIGTLPNGGEVHRTVKKALSAPARALPERRTVEPPTKPLQREHYLPGGSSPRLDRDPAQQTVYGPLAMPNPLLNFDGIYNYWGGIPPDTVGDVGPNHYVQMVNVGFQVYDKATGNPVTGVIDFNELYKSVSFGGQCEAQNAGDPIVVYDQLADRWLLSQFTAPLGLPADEVPAGSGPYFECIAISMTGDPTGAYHLYAFQTSEANFEDYPHFGVWPDAYYMATNEAQGGVIILSAGFFAFERDKMLAGDPDARMIYFSRPFPDGGYLPSDLDGYRLPPEGSPNYFMSPNRIQGDSVRLYKFDITTWDPAPVAALVGPIDIPVEPFDSDAPAIPQPGGAPSLDSISDRFMNRLAYRNMGTHESLVVNHTVNVVEGDNERSSIRWYEFRNPNAAMPTVHQESTFAPPDGLNRWMASAAMDGAGNIAIGYSVGGSSLFPSIRYAGRLATDPLDQLTQGEQTLITGGGAQTETIAGRWGDYSSLNVDVDDCTFWYTTEYYAQTGLRNWRTRIGSFKMPNCVAGSTQTPVPTGTPATPTRTPSASPTSCPAVQTVQGSITMTDNLVVGRLGRDGVPSTCGTTKECPALADQVQRHYRTHRFFNNSLNPQCITVSVVSNCGDNALLSAAYVDDFNPDNQCENYLGDMGSAGPDFSYSFTVPAQRSFVVAVLENSANVGCANYTVSVNQCQVGTAVPSVTGTPPTATPTRTKTATPTATATPCATDILFSEGFELGTLGTFTATHPASPAGDSPWTVSAAAAHTGNWSAHVRNNDVESDQRLEMINAVSVPQTTNNVQMQFHHRYVFETIGGPASFDGGVLEYSTNNGTNWTDAGSLITEGGYNSVLGGPGNPLTGRQGWGSTMPGHPAFSRVTVNLNSLKGQSVKFRFRHGSDESGDAEGWFVDNVRLLVQLACGTALPTTTSSPTVTATACPIQFQDVPPSADVSSFYPYVRCLACRGIVGGYPCGGTNPETNQPEPCGTSGNPYYRPANQITRGQISKIVAGASGSTGDPGPQKYEDVPPNSPFYQWINRLSNEGVMGGYPCGGPNEPCGNGNRPYFRPGANATRGQMSKIVSNAAGFNEEVTGQSFEDLPPSDEPSSYYQYVERLHARGIVGGYPCGGAGEECGDEGRPYFRPNNPVTRGQAAKIVANTFYPNCQTPARR